MASAQVIDTASRTRQLTQFLRQRNAERNQRMQLEANAKQAEFLTSIHDGNARPGVMLSHVDIIARLTRLNPSLVVLQSSAYPDRAGIYIRDGQSNLADLNAAYRGLRFVTGMCWGMVPENSVGTVVKDEKGDPQGTITRKGWRTTLCNLVQAGLIPLAATEKAFGMGEKGWHQRLH